MKDGDFDRLRIPLDDGTGPTVPDDADDPDEAVGASFARSAGVALSPARLAAGSAVLAALILAGFAALRRGRRRPAGRTGDTD